MDAVNTFGIKFWELGWTKWGFLGRNGLNPKVWISGLKLACLSERTVSLFRSSCSEARVQKRVFRSTYVQKRACSEAHVQKLLLRSSCSEVRVQKHVCSEASLFRSELCVLTELRFSRCSCFFTHFCFELVFGVNTKVVDNWVIFTMALVLLENVLWISS